MSLPGFNDVEAAAKRLEGLVVKTPIIRSEILDALTGAKVFIKPECLQETGSFKLRGATNRIAAMEPSDFPGGVVAFSSGNHAQGVARAARRAGLPALIVMPKDAPEVKTEGVLSDGAEIHLYDRNTESREEIAAEIAAERGALLIPSYDDPYILTGQGTAALELILDIWKAREAPLDHYISCAGGGGLMAGAALAFEGMSAKTRLWTAEPEHFDDHKRSFEAGERVAIEAPVPSICDAILTPVPGELTFAINRSRVSGGFVVTEDEVRAAMQFAFRHLKLVVEPGGSVALAALLSGKLKGIEGKRVGIILSGGNVDPGLFAQLVAG